MDRISNQRSNYLFRPRTPLTLARIAWELILVQLVRVRNTTINRGMSDEDVASVTGEEYTSDTDGKAEDFEYRPVTSDQDEESIYDSDRSEHGSYRSGTDGESNDPTTESVSLDLILKETDDGKYYRIGVFESPSSEVGGAGFFKPLPRETLIIV